MFVTLSCPGEFLPWLGNLGCDQLSQLVYHLTIKVVIDQSTKN